MNHSCPAINLTANSVQSSSFSVSNSEMPDPEDTKNRRERQRNRPFSCRLLFVFFSTRPLSTLSLFSVSSVLNPERATINGCTAHTLRQLLVQNHIASKMLMPSDSLNPWVFLLALEACQCKGYYPGNRLEWSRVWALFGAHQK